LQIATRWSWEDTDDGAVLQPRLDLITGAGADRRASRLILTTSLALYLCLSPAVSARTIISDLSRCCRRAARASTKTGASLQATTSRSDGSKGRHSRSSP
jgi:hypothetical protein